jgi:hypothetical protein
MAQEIEIRSYGDTYVGSVTFNESPQRLHAERTADGFRLQIPITISFKLVPRGEPMPVVGNFRGIIYAGEDSGPKIQVGEGAGPDEDGGLAQGRLFRQAGTRG